jgi:hypothetical protein
MALSGRRLRAFAFNGSAIQKVGERHGYRLLSPVTA